MSIVEESLGKAEDLSGRRFGRLTVESFSHKINRQTCWNCICDCGARKKINRSSLISGGTVSCGCKKIKYEQKIIGKKFGKLTPIERNSGGYFLCRCDCGEVKSIRGANIRGGLTKSCGCIKSEITRERNYKHGLRHTRFYSIWLNMLDRCRNSNNINFHNYGGRGISVCEEWTNFENFRDDMYKEYNEKVVVVPNCQIDRIDNDGGYEKRNCRFVTPKENNNNKDCRRISLRKLNEQQVKEIFKIKELRGLSNKKIGKMFGVSSTVIFKILKGHNYKEIM